MSLSTLHTHSLRPKRYRSFIPLSSRDQFRQNIARFIQGTMTDAATNRTTDPIVSSLGLKKVPPYWYPYTTMAKMRWLGRELLEVVSTEFRDRSMEYYVRW
jgi:tRNA pseudouridine synthase 9